MNMDGIVDRMNEERAGAKRQREKLAGELRAVEERIERIGVALAEIEKASGPRRGRPRGAPAATSAAAPTNGRRRRRGADGRVTAKDAMYRTLERIGRDGGAKAKVLRETAEKTFGREITSKSASNALNTLKHEGKVRREGFFWHLADAPAASGPEPDADETPPATDAPPAAEDA